MNFDSCRHWSWLQRVSSFHPFDDQDGLFCNDKAILLKFVMFSVSSLLSEMTST